MTEDRIIIGGICFAVGFMVCLFIDVVRDLIMWRRRAKAKPIDTSYDQDNFINQRNSWEPVQVDGVTLYELHTGRS